MTPIRHSTIAFLGVLGICFYLVILMIWPFVTPIIFGCIIAGVFYPLTEFGVNRCRLSRPWAAIIVLILIILSIFLPMVYIIINIVNEATQLYIELKSLITEGEMLQELEEIFQEIFFGDGYIPNFLQQAFEFFNLEYKIETLRKAIVDFGQKLSGIMFDTLNALNSWIANILNFMYDFIVMMAVIFSLFVSGPKLRRFITLMLPIPLEEQEQILHKFNQMNYMTFVSNGLGAFLQGGMAGITFWFLGFEAFLLWTLFMIILAFIPLVGMSVIYIPATIYLFFQDRIVAAIFLAIFCTGVALIVENWFKPKFMGKTTEIDSMLVLFSMLGGISAFGMFGIFYGPLIMTLFLTLIELYHHKYRR